MQVANRISKVEAHKPFWIIESNFAEAEQIFPKNIVVATTIESPIRLMEISTEMGYEISKYLNIVYSPAGEQNQVGIQDISSSGKFKKIGQVVRRIRRRPARKSLQMIGRPSVEAALI